MDRNPELVARLERAHLYVVSGDADPERQVDILAAAIEGGAEVVQLRHKTADKGALLRAARRLRDLSRDAVFIVNDHVDVAMAAGADGVHLGQDDLPIEVARDIWPAGLVGVSTHSIDQAADAVARGADYIGVGPVFATPTKPGRPAVGTEYVRAVAASAGIPWFAIGGINEQNVEDVLAAGATRIAVVRAVFDAADPSAAAATLRDVIAAAQTVTA